MRRWTLAGIVALLLCGGLAGDMRHGAPTAEAGVDVPGLIEEASAFYGVSAVTMKRLAWCESRWFPGAFNRSSGASGLFQFLKRTWDYASWRAGYGGASPFDAEANAFSAAWLMRYVGPGQWSCR